MQYPVQFQRGTTSTAIFGIVDQDGEQSSSSWCASSKSSLLTVAKVALIAIVGVMVILGHDQDEQPFEPRHAITVGRNRREIVATSHPSSAAAFRMLPVFATARRA